ncbi:transcription termination factor Rho [Pseudonocardia phyllosphaerae]|uniref:transcription termination factor Rho n=1 Tax=Pseudonocardia phyllosphaerae TaxID=3390502 RepID=UPI00397E440A
MSETDLAGTGTASTEAAPRRRGGLSGMVLAELRQLATELNVPDISGMRKGDLIAAIKERQGGASTPARKPRSAASEQGTSGDSAGTDASQLSLSGTEASASDAGGSAHAASNGGASNGSAASASTGAAPATTGAPTSPNTGSDAGSDAEDTAPRRRRRAASRPAGAPAAGGAAEAGTTSPEQAEKAVEQALERNLDKGSDTGPDKPQQDSDGPQQDRGDRDAEQGRRNGGDRGDRGGRDNGRDNNSEGQDGGRRGRTRRRGQGDDGSDNRPDNKGDNKPDNRGDNKADTNGQARTDNGQDEAQGERRRNKGGNNGGNNNGADNNDGGGRNNNDGQGGGRNRNRNDRNNNDDNGGGRNNNRNDRNNNDDTDDDGDGRGRRGRRFRDRRRGRDRDGRGGGGGNVDTEIRDDDVLLPVAGIVDILDNYAFVRTTGYLSGPTDVYVSMSMVRKNGLRRGDAITGAVRQPREGEQSRQKFNPLVRVDTINGREPDATRQRPEFTKLTPLYPNERLRLETEPTQLTSRVIDLVMPVGKGQRALIVSPPKAGKTTIMQSIANAITTNNPECHLMVVLVDERPEEVTDMQRSVKGEVIASTFDRPPSDHTAVAELSIERAKRLVEMGHDVVVLLDNITRLGRAYNLAAPASGRILSGGVDSTALYPPKRFLGAARNIEDGGSLTIFATALVETGSTMDTVIFEEFKGTGNAELKLDRKIADKRVFPAIDIGDSGTRKEELLMSPDEHAVMVKLRRILAALDDQQAIDLVLSRLKKTKTNIEFLMQVAKNAPGTQDED